MKREHYKRYGFGRPKKIVDPKWVKDLPKDDGHWTMEQEEAYSNTALFTAGEDIPRKSGIRFTRNEEGRNGSHSPIWLTVCLTTMAWIS